MKIRLFALITLAAVIVAGVGAQQAGFKRTVRRRTRRMGLGYGLGQAIGPDSNRLRSCVSSCALPVAR